MAGSTKAELRTDAYTERGHSSVGQSEEGSRSYLVAPGLDQFYELLSRYGLAVLVFGSVAFGFWLLWAVDFSGGR